MIISELRDQLEEKREQRSRAEMDRIFREEHRRIGRIARNRAGLFNEPLDDCLQEVRISLYKLVQQYGEDTARRYFNQRCWWDVCHAAMHHSRKKRSGFKRRIVKDIGRGDLALSAALRRHAAQQLLASLERECTITPMMRRAAENYANGNWHSDLADEVGLTRERVRQLFEAYCGKMRHAGATKIKALEAYFEDREDAAIVIEKHPDDN